MLAVRIAVIDGATARTRGAAQPQPHRSTAAVPAQVALDVFLNDVELPPTADPVYSSVTDTKVKSLCQGSFCV